jgi:hypothetical protein
MNNEVIQSIRSEELKERVLSIIDKIFQGKEELWGYIRYIHMVDHGERHTRNVMDLLTRFLVYSQRQLLNELTDMEKFCLIFAVWFHDVGGRGLSEQDEKIPKLPIHQRRTPLGWRKNFYKNGYSIRLFR